MEYKCPYCNKSNYNSGSRKSGKFESWLNVRGHIPSCISNNSEYFIDLNEGPIHYSGLKNLNGYQIKAKYPNLRSKLNDIKKGFYRKGFNINCSTRDIWNKESIIEAVQQFYKENKRIPQFRNFEITKGKYPGRSTVINHFQTWNKAIEAAGFTPNYDTGYGTKTKALDNVLYRSIAEAEFVSKFLFEKYEYIVEPKYPEPYNRYYDWYIPKLDLYIELDGEIRPEVIIEKIAINKLLSRKLLVIKTKDINKFTNLKEFITVA